MTAFEGAWSRIAAATASAAVSLGGAGGATRLCTRHCARHAATPSPTPRLTIAPTQAPMTAQTPGPTPGPTPAPTLDLGEATNPCSVRLLHHVAPSGTPKSVLPQAAHLRQRTSPFPGLRENRRGKFGEVQFCGQGAMDAPAPTPSCGKGSGAV